jgi:hypothetical protein
MSQRQFLFYATGSDLGPLLSSLEAQRRLQYTLTDLFETNQPQTYLSYADIPDFGRASFPSSPSNQCYLVSIRGTVVNVRNVPQKAGGILFAIDQKLNEDTVNFWPGGEFGNGILLYGEVNTISNTVTSRSLYDSMEKVFSQSFTQVQEFLVGPEAVNLCKAGVRLTLSASTPAEFDLKPQFL